MGGDLKEHTRKKKQKRKKTPYWKAMCRQSAHDQKKRKRRKEIERFKPESSTKNLQRHLRPKVQDAYSVHPTYSVLQGIQLELQSGRTRSDRPR